MNSISKKNIIFSIRPQYADQILDGNKTVELRRRFPNGTTEGSQALIYASTPTKALIGSATIVCVHRLAVSSLKRRFLHDACIASAAFDDYFEGLRIGYAILLTDPYRFPKMMPVAALREEYGFVPPQSFRYVYGEIEQLLNDERVQVPHRHKRRRRA